MDYSTPSFPVHHQLPALAQIMSFKSVMPSNHLILCCPLPLLPSIFPSIRVFSNGQFFTSGGQSIGASALASVLPMNIQDWFPFDWLVWCHCSPRDSQDSSPTPQFKSINSSVLSFLYGPTLVSTHDYWKTFYHRNNFNVALELHWVGQKVCLGSSLELFGPTKSGLTLLEQY